MDASTSLETHGQHHHEAGHEHAHHELGFWRKYIFSTDHKVIGIQYGICGLIFLFLGSSWLMLIGRQPTNPVQGRPSVWSESGAASVTSCDARGMWMTHACS